MTSERPPGVPPPPNAKTLARSSNRRKGPRPYNLPSMKKSNISDSNHVEVIPSGTTGWAKTPKPSQSEDSAVSNTWTVPPRVAADRKLSALKTVESRTNEVTKGLDPKPTPAKVPEPVPSTSSVIENPFGVDINVTSWAREVSPPPPAKRAWSDASPMDFSKPVVFDQTPVVPAVKHAGPLLDNAWRPAVVRKPTVSSILKKPESEKQLQRPESEKQPQRPDSEKQPQRLDSEKQPQRLDSEKQPQRLDSEKQPQRPDSVSSATLNDVAQVESVIPGDQQIPATVVDEAVQTMTMKQKAMEAMKRRQEEERLREEGKKARLAEKLAALEKKKPAAAKPSITLATISVMQRPKSADEMPAAVADSKSSEPTQSNAVKNSTAETEPNFTNVPEPAVAENVHSEKGQAAFACTQNHPENARRISDAREHLSETQKHSSDFRKNRSSDMQDRSEDQKPSRSGRNQRRQVHRRHQDVPGSRSSSNVWHRRSNSRSVDQDDGQRLLEKETNEGEKMEPAPGLDFPSGAITDRDVSRRDDKSKRAPKIMARNQPKPPVSPPSTETAPAQSTVPVVTSSKLKSKPMYNHRKWRAKEPVSPSLPSPPPSSSSPVVEQKNDVVNEKKPTPTLHHQHGPRQWKSRTSDINQSRQSDSFPSSSENQKNLHRRKRFGPVFENSPVVGSQAGSLMWSAAAPVVATTPSPLPPPRSWSTPKSNSHNAELLNQQQSRAKGSPSAALAKRALAETLASRSS